MKLKAEEVELVTDDMRIHKDICGVTEIGGTGMEWICVREPHAVVYYRRISDRTHKRGDPIYSTNRQADQHYMVRRWPNRDKES